MRERAVGEQRPDPTDMQIGALQQEQGEEQVSLAPGDPAAAPVRLRATAGVMATGPGAMSGSRFTWFGPLWWRLCLCDHHP